MYRERSRFQLFDMNMIFREKLSQSKLCYSHSELYVVAILTNNLLQKRALSKNSERKEAGVIAESLLRGDDSNESIDAKKLTMPSNAFILECPVRKAKYSLFKAT